MLRPPSRQGSDRGDLGNLPFKLVPQLTQTHLTKTDEKLGGVEQGRDSFYIFIVERIIYVPSPHSLIPKGILY